MITKGQAIQAYKYIRKLTVENSNDQELGKKIRYYFNKLNQNEIIEGDPT